MDLIFFLKYNSAMNAGIQLYSYIRRNFESIKKDILSPHQASKADRQI